MTDQERKEMLQNLIDRFGENEAVDRFRGYIIWLDDESLLEIYKIMMMK